MAEFGSQHLSDDEIRLKLAEMGHPVGPVTETTRRILLRRLGMLINKRDLAKYSSAEEESENEHGGPGRSRRVSMPPPASFRARRRTSGNAGPSSPLGPNSALNSTIGDFRGSRPLGESLTGIISRNYHGTPRRANAGFESFSGSDSDARESANSRSSRARSSRALPILRGSAISTTFRASVSPSPPSSPRESRPSLSNLTRRQNRVRNDVNDIKETDVDEGSTCVTRPFIYRPSAVAPVKPVYARIPAVEGYASLKKHLPHWGPMVLLGLFFLFFLFLGGLYILRVYLALPVPAKQSHVYPICKDNEIGNTRCIPPEELPFAVALYRTVHQELLQRAVDSLCGPKLADGSSVRPYMTARELVQFLLKTRPNDVMEIEEGVRHLALLLISNPHWGVAVVTPGGEDDPPPTARCNIPEARKAVPSDLTSHGLLFITPCPHLSYSCKAKLFFYTSAYYITASVLVGSLMYGVFVLARHYVRKAKEEEEEVMALVEKILKQVTESCSQGQPYIAIRHVHDTIIPIKDRARLAPLWERAVQYLEDNESRVRREVQTVYGEETAVYRMLTSPASFSPSSPSVPSSSPATENHLYPDLSSQMQREGQRVWQGEAFETSEGSMNSLPVSPTPCLKIRHMFQPNKNYGADWEVAVRDAIIEKCEGVRILHVVVDSQSKEGCVYVKCSSPYEAGEAFRRLHGAWFDGALVTVKYLRLERYHDRFPDSVHSRSPLTPSNNLRLSLGGKR